MGKHMCLMSLCLMCVFVFIVFWFYIYIYICIIVELWNLMCLFVFVGGGCVCVCVTFRWSTWHKTHAILKLCVCWHFEIVMLNTTNILNIWHFAMVFCVLCLWCAVFTLWNVELLDVLTHLSTFVCVFWLFESCIVWNYCVLVCHIVDTFTCCGCPGLC